MSLDFAKEVSNADSLIQAILNKNNKDEPKIGLGDKTKVKPNTRLVLNWMFDNIAHKKYEEKIGYTEDQTLWYKKKHGNVFLKKMELLCPCLTQT